MGKVMSADEKVIDAESKKVAESVSEQTTENAVEEVVKEPAANSAAEENIKKTVFFDIALLGFISVCIFGQIWFFCEHKFDYQ